jgi:hypothetical protein
LPPLKIAAVQNLFIGKIKTRVHKIILIRIFKRLFQGLTGRDSKVRFRIFHVWLAIHLPQIAIKSKACFKPRFDAAKSLNLIFL